MSNDNYFSFIFFIIGVLVFFMAIAGGAVISNDMADLHGRIKVLETEVLRLNIQQELNSTKRPSPPSPLLQPRNSTQDFLNRLFPRNKRFEDISLDRFKSKCGVCRRGEISRLKRRQIRPKKKHIKSLEHFFRHDRNLRDKARALRGPVHLYSY